MPHKCRDCGEQYPDGCEDILNGCTTCGSRKFQYITAETPLKEDKSQHKARTEIVSDSETPQKIDLNQSDLPTSTHAKQDSRSVSEISDILNEQFEGIKLIKPGEYEINLTKLFEGDAHIITIQENGKFVVDVPKTFQNS